ncbi:MAG: UvrD-helicase domain-containing protein, partial [Synergistaceae bacterium]|nr:UvrD-helicase domain-containing protein [Synergistaceae bacterium]
MTNTEFETRFCAARRKVIAGDFGRLNDMQREAVMATEGPLLLLAGAGSGKTTVLINRIANLLKYGRGSDCCEMPDNVGEAELAVLETYVTSGSDELRNRAQELSALEPVEAWRIMAITFTNKAANELKERLEHMLGSTAQEVWAMTFHSACVRILRRDCEKINYDRGFAIYDTSDSQSVMKRVLKDLNIDDKMFPHRMVLSQISKAKDALLAADEFLDQAKAAGDLRRIQIGKAYLEYSRRLREANAMDFDDLIYNTVRLLLEHADVRDYYQRRFKYVLIDEYQDTNNLQYLLASNLVGRYENICVVGDDDQSIYKFRGATIENILNFECQYKGARTIRLEQNYRSTGHILGAANAVISNNIGRKGKELWTKAEDGDKLSLYVAQNENDEAQYVAARILEHYAAGESWRENAILYRM